MTVARPGTLATSHLASYVPDPHRYDELLDTDGTIRAHWRPLRAAAAGTERWTSRGGWSSKMA